MANIRTLLAAAAATASLACLSAPAMAQNGWQAQHPRRAQVNARLATQDARIDQEVRTGQIGPRQAAHLHAADQRIRAQEEQMAARHGGHITAREQAKLNAEEDRVSHRIGV
ncbi:MAG TPA: hypothetical protein VMU52_09225 [Steroidobacteraceae bacterium]|nr:hypothetical protein [Steroidobacteraceae bacterium]